MNMLNREQEPCGVNLNSPIIQAMLKNTPPGKGNFLKGYYGPTPTITEEYVPVNAQGEIMGPGIPATHVEQPAPTPYQMLNQAGMQNYQLPSYQFTGALSGAPASPSYFDVNQPIAHQQQPMNGLGGMTPYPQAYCYYPQQQYNSMCGYPGGPVPPALGQQFYQAPPPSWLRGAPPGTIYSNVAAYQYPNVQENPYNPLPSSDAIAGNQYQPQMPIQGYSNPYMNGGVYVPPQRQDVYAMARHNYAVEFGFQSVEEMEQNDFAVLKALSVVANKSLGLSDEEIEKKLEICYDKPRAERLNGNIRKSNGMYHEFNADAPVIEPLNVSIVIGDKVLVEAKAENQPKNLLNLNRMLNPGYDYMIDIYKRYRFDRDQFNSQLHASALERRYDGCDILGYFNEAFYDIRMRDMAIEEKRNRDSLVKQMYDSTAFKREVMARAGRPAMKNKIILEDSKFHKSDPVPDGVIRGGYGYLPGGIPMEKDSDPRFGYCFQFNTNTGQLEIKSPRSDEELQTMKNRFINSIGKKRGMK